MCQYLQHINKIYSIDRYYVSPSFICLFVCFLCFFVFFYTFIYPGKNIFAHG